MNLTPPVPSLGDLSTRFPWHSPPPDPSVDNLYTIRVEENGPRFLTARGDLPRVTQVFLDVIRTVTGSLGLVLVEVTPVPREWLVSSIPRARILEGLFSIRDLLGSGHLDVAVFSGRHGVEFFLDRLGTLEIRTGSWLEPRMRGVLESQGFERVGHLTTLPQVRDPIDWTDEHQDRVDQVRTVLGCRPVPPRDRGSQRP